MRFRKRGRYDRETIVAILDSALVCHVGFVLDDHPYVVPTLYWREDDQLYWHGSAKSRMMRAAEGAPVCVTVTQLDGIVLARSAFNHSANYRSVTLLGKAIAVTEPAEKLARMRSMMESIIPDRWDSLRPVTAKEIAATRILSIPIEEASAKLREGPPNDIDDVGWPVWAGVIPLRTAAEPPERDADAHSCLEPAPPSLRVGWRRLQLTNCL